MKYCIWFLVSVAILISWTTLAHAQDSIPPTWTYSAGSTIRYASVTGGSITLGVDSTVIIIDRTSGVEQFRFVTHDGMIEGAHVQPDGSTCIVVSAAQDRSTGTVVNAVVEYDVASGVELRRMQLNTVKGLCWEPAKVLTLCAFSDDGQYLYTSSAVYHTCNDGLIAGGSGQRVNLTSFIVDQTYGGGWGSVATSADGRLLIINGTSGYLDTTPNYGGWKSIYTSRVRIPSDTGDVWHYREHIDLKLASNERFIYDRKNIYDTIGLLAIPNNDLLSTIEITGICTNAKNYFTFPNAVNNERKTITVREFVTNRVTHELTFSDGSTNVRQLVYDDDTTFIALQSDRIVAWSVNLEPEFPPRLAQLVSDTIASMTWYPAVVRTLPLGITYQASLRSTSLHIGTNMVIAPTAGDHVVDYTLVGPTSDTTVGAHSIHAIARSFDPRSHFGIAASGVNNILWPSLDASGRYLGAGNGSCLFVAAVDTPVVQGRYYLNELMFRGLIVSPTGTVYGCRDSLMRIWNGSDGHFEHSRILLFGGLSLGGEPTPERSRKYAEGSDVEIVHTSHGRWDPDYHWMYLLRTKKPGNEFGPMYSTVVDAVEGSLVPSSEFYGGSPLSFSRDPQTGRFHWIAHPRPVTSMWGYDKWFRFEMHADGSCDSTAIPGYRTLAFVVGGAYILSSGQIYDRSWQKVGPDTNQALFTGPFLGARPYAIATVKQTSTTPAYLKIRHVPDGRTVDSVAFDRNIVGFSSDSSGQVIALSFSDTTVQLFYIDSLVTSLMKIAKNPDERPGSDTTHITDTGTVRLFPHPVADAAEIIFHRWTSAPITMSIRDLQGHVVFTAVVPDTSNTIFWDRRGDGGARLSPGPYLLMFSDGNTVQRKVIIVE